MKKPPELKTKIFLDSGDPQETAQVLSFLGFLDGQTTNPSLVAKNPDVAERLISGNRFTVEELLGMYRDIVHEIEKNVPNGSISIEVYADNSTTAEEMILQATQMAQWTRNAYIKLPINRSGLDAAQKLTSVGMNLNMTLCFSQAQAIAVYNATSGAKKGQVYLSPFIGRLDDTGEMGLDLIKHIIALYSRSDEHVEVLAASVRTLDHFVACIHLGCDCITAPLSVLKQWAEAGMPTQCLPVASKQLLHPIEFTDLSLGTPWKQIDLSHQLTQIGIEKFAQDWNQLLTEQS